MEEKSSEILIKRIKSLFNSSNPPILVDRAFTGLYITLLLLKKKTNKRKVLISSNSCAAPIYACMYAGFTPVFVDVNLDDCLMDFEEVQNGIKSNDDIAAILYIYLFGHISEDILKISLLSKENDIFLIEDVAQAFGSNIDGQLAGTIGDISVFSFGRTKQVDAGAGGFILNNSSNWTTLDFNEEISKISKYDVSKELRADYSATFYNLREDSFENRASLSLFTKFYNKYKPLYFNKIEVNWKDCLNKLNYFIEEDLMGRRNEIALKYEDFFNRSSFNFLYSWATIQEGYSTYRYTIITKDYKISNGLSTRLRSLGIHCSNLYLPFGRIYNNSGYENSLFMAKGVINLWVDPSVVSNEYIENTFKAFNNYQEASGILEIDNIS